MRVTCAVSILSLLCYSGANAEVTEIAYSDNGDPLKGYLSKPSSPGNLTTPASSLPAVVILSDWNGVNDYEIKRAKMISEELGYVAFAADNFGKDLIDIDTQGKIDEIMIYRTNVTLWMSRIKSAIDVVKGVEEVDDKRIALIGYCFGGTGAITYATLGHTDVGAVVSFHGGLAGLDYKSDTAIIPKMQINSGGDDDTSTHIENLEMVLNGGNATWEINRFADVQHAFTEWDDDRYNERADKMSWESMGTFLREAMGDVDYEPYPDPVQPFEAVAYTDDIDGASLEGYLSEPKGLTKNDKLPAVVVLPDWDGTNKYEQTRVQMLADLGYVAFAADIYGVGLHNVEAFGDKVSNYTKYRSNATLFNSRINAAVTLAKSFTGVDPDKIILAGYCFGGTGVLMYALSGYDDVHTVVSIHGGLRLENATEEVHPRILVLSGGDDDTSSSIEELEVTLNKAESTWQISRYSDVEHGFTKFGTDVYQLRADTRSWEAMQQFLKYDGLSVEDVVESGADTSGAGWANLNFLIAALIVGCFAQN
mmetsp:Transcript_85/g.112  ORF Transcript_85/g.112 Transcript_85/m.112 type:complete len:536 (-) Transcript_85:146-1753(-)|eukprot:CAMPEP_0172493232 /NCGR_PEP_ID=MMETSP1066-20121228/24605_1 /TAXON_ID=671091 /ORGANISM="Coscinodiscus wailesii, Strain CCMP2513" /LENGTH=535 /DNA_ID=CAMNT_0013263289 /DNA_START=56 /DNA_END=1663 /DNA_ORIENTATION=-